MMREMDRAQTSPAPEASDHLKVFIAAKYGVDICCHALKVINQQDTKEQMSVLSDISCTWKLYSGAYQALSKSQKGDRKSQPVPVTDVHHVVEECVMPAMKEMSTTVLEEEQSRFDAGLLCNHASWTEERALCLEAMYNNGQLAGEMASIPSHTSSNLVELYGMCGEDSLASKATSASVVDTMRRALANAYHAVQQRPTLSAIDREELETTFKWSSTFARRMDEFFVHKKILESINDTLQKAEHEGTLEEDSHMICMHAFVLSAYVIPPQHL